MGEARAMRVGGAIATVGKGKADVACFLVGRGIVAEFAANLGVQSGERIPAEGMIKAENIDRFPIEKVVTLETVGPDAPFMGILMAVGAVRRDSQECLTKVVNLNGC